MFLMNDDILSPVAKTLAAGAYSGENLADKAKAILRMKVDGVG